MSAGSTGMIGPVSARYAAQIRELLQVQAVQRMAADQEAARADADRKARAEAAAKSQPSDPLRVKVERPVVAAPEQPAEPAAEAPAPSGQIVDIQA